MNDNETTSKMQTNHNENNFKNDEYESEIFKRRKMREYKEDLDYLISLRKQLGDEEFDRLYGNEIIRRSHNMDDKYVYNLNENKNFRKNFSKVYNQYDILSHADKQKNQKLNELELDKKFLNSIEYQNYLENQKKVEQKLKLKNEYLNDMDKFSRKKYELEVKKYEDVLNNHKLIDEQIRKQDERDFYHRNKLNSINNKIYDKAIKFNDYIQNKTNSPICNEPFYLKNDHEFNRRVAEIKNTEKENLKKDQTALNQRLKEEQLQYQFENKLKAEKFDNQKSYKEFLDYQNNLYRNSDKKDLPNLNQLIMPSYHYYNRPLATSKKAIDSINWVKNNHTETLHNGYKNFYLGDSQLKHNPIIQPLDDIEYNKYLNRERKLVGFNSPLQGKSGNQLVSSSN